MHSPATFDRAILSLHRALAWNGPLITLLGLALALTAGLLLIRLTPLDGVFLVVLVVGGVATLIEPLAGLALALFLGPLRAYLSAEVVQVPAQIGQVFVALTLAVWLARGLARREIRFPPAEILYCRNWRPASPPRRPSPRRWAWVCA